MLKEIRAGIELFESTRENQDYSGKLDQVVEFLNSTGIVLPECLVVQLLNYRAWSTCLEPQIYTTT